MAEIEQTRMLSFRAGPIAARLAERLDGQPAGHVARRDLERYYTLLAAERVTWRGQDHASWRGALQAGRLARRLVLRRGLDPLVALDAASEVTRRIGAARYADEQRRGQRRLAALLRLSLAVAVRRSDGSWETNGLPADEHGYYPSPWGRQPWPEGTIRTLARARIGDLLRVIEQMTGQRFVVRATPKFGPPLDSAVPESPLNWLSLQWQPVT